MQTNKKKTGGLVDSDRIRARGSLGLEIVKGLGLGLGGVNN